MKNQLTYGFAIAVAGAVLTLLLYLLGLHSSIEKLSQAQGIGLTAGLAISITCIFLGQRARRQATPPHEDFSYGQAFGTGITIALLAAVFGTLFNYVYFAFINPGFSELIVETQLAKLEEQGRSGPQMDAAEKMIRMMAKPSVFALSGFINILVMGAIISLVTAAFAKRSALPPTDEPPVHNR